MLGSYVSGSKRCRGCDMSTVRGGDDGEPYFRNSQPTKLPVCMAVKSDDGGTVMYEKAWDFISALA